MIYQFDRALLLLAHAPANSQVASETLGDIVIQSIDGEDILAIEEDKHSISGATQFAGDRSEAIWKTLKNWLEIRKDTTKQIHNYILVTNVVGLTGFVADLGRQPKSLPDCDRLIGEIRKIAATSSTTSPSTVDSHIAFVSACDDVLLRDVIQKTLVIDGTREGAPGEIQRQLVNALLLSSDVDAHALIDMLRGWLCRVSAASWRKRESAWVSRSIFVEQVEVAKSTCRRRKKKRERAAALVPITSAEITSESSSRFVHHLIEIDADEVLIERAIVHYLRYSKEKFRLLDDGVVTEEDFADRADELTERWLDISARHRHGLKTKSAQEVGHDIYGETTDFKADLAGDATYESYLTVGQYHRLANEDLVWWDPGYRRRSIRGTG